MIPKRTSEQEAVYQQCIAEATEAIIEGNQQISELASKETTFCGPGCSACCCQILSFHPVAFEVIWHRIERDSLLRQRVESNNVLRNALIEKHMTKIEKISKIKDQLQFMGEWVSLRIPCTLLYEDKCMIYDIRPYICAAYMTLSPPRVCAIDPKGYSPKTIQAAQKKLYMALNNLQGKYNLPGGALQNLSWHLDYRLNLFQEEPVKQERKKNV